MQIVLKICWRVCSLKILLTVKTNLYISPCSWGSRHSFARTLCRDGCPLSALSETGETVGSSSYSTRRAASAGLPVGLSPETTKRALLQWINTTFLNERRFFVSWKRCKVFHCPPTLSDMQSVILRSTQSLSPVDRASARRSLVIAFMTRLVNWRSVLAPECQRTHRKGTDAVMSPAGDFQFLLKLLFVFSLPDSSSRFIFLLSFSSFLLLFFAATCFSQCRCFLRTFLCSLNRQITVSTAIILSSVKISEALLEISPCSCHPPLSQQPSTCPPPLHPWIFSEVLLFSSCLVASSSTSLVQYINHSCSAHVSNFTSKMLNLSCPSDVSLCQCHCLQTIIATRPVIHLNYRKPDLLINVVIVFNPDINLQYIIKLSVQARGPTPGCRN